MHRLPAALPVLSRRSTRAHSTITPRGVDFSRWYGDVLAAADWVDAATPVRGCAILKPGGYAVWEAVQAALDARLKARGVRNAYFPLLVPASLLAHEAAHVAGFAGECAVVTHSRLAPGGRTPDPTSVLAEPYVVRPTSEAIVWDALSRWVRSPGDLPQLLNQWASVVRWELRPRVLLRSSEFLWQEGHTAHASEAEAVAWADAMHGEYVALCASTLSLPVVAGRKSVGERFAGALDTLTCEAMAGNGWALQAATSHYLGTAFGAAYGVKYVDSSGVTRHPWGTSWGASTRLLGACVLAHGDDVGLVLPPPVAPVQVVVVAIAGRGGGGGPPAVAAAAAVAATLSSAGVRVALDDNIGAPAGGRFFKWEREGVRLRLEVGPREADAGVVSVAARAGGPTRTPRPTLPTTPGALIPGVRAALSSVATALFDAAAARMASNTVEVASLGEMVERVVAAKGAGGGDGTHPYTPQWPMFAAPWVEDAASEAVVKSSTGYTLRCYPTSRQGRGAVVGSTCIVTGKPATHVALFARAF